MRYFKRPWGELRGDEYDSWGSSTWYFEIGSDLYPTRQLEAYQDGTVLTYDRGHSNDEFGGLGDQPIELAEFLPFEIGQDVFEAAWRDARALNRRGFRRPPAS